MENELKISIVTPSCNTGDCIDKTIQSVINQDYGNYEYFVVDFGSTDGTLEILKKYQNKLTSLVCENDRKQAYAINKGFKLATGDIVAFIKSDSVYCEGAFRQIADYFAKHPEIQWVAGNMLYEYQDGNVLERKKPIASPFLFKQGLMHLYQPNVFIKRSLLSSVGYLREDLDSIMDFEWFCRIGQKYPIGLLDKDIAKSRRNVVPTSSKSGSQEIDLYMKERIIVHSQYIPFVKNIVHGFETILLFFITSYGRTWRNLFRLRNKFFK